MRIEKMNINTKKIWDVANSKAPLFVIGMPRSGTTVISEAISVHEDLGWLSNYINWFPKLPQLAILSRVIDIPHIGPHLRGKKKQDKHISSFLRRLLPFSDEAYPVWNRYCVENFATDYLKNRCATSLEKERTLALVSKVLRYQRKKRFFSKLTGPPRIRYLNSIFPNAYFIHVIRDPRANISSLLKVSFWKKNEGYTRPWWTNGLSPEAMDEWDSCGKLPIALGAIQWREIIEAAWQEKKIIDKNRYIEIRYEDFVKDPIEILNSICNHVGLQPSKNILHYTHSIGKVCDMNYKYNKNLTEKEIKLIEKLTYSAAKQAGY